MLPLRQPLRRSLRTVVRYSSSTANVPIKVSPSGTLAKPAVPETSIGRLHPPLKGGYKSQGTSVVRTIRNIWKAGWRRAFWQIKEVNDTKVCRQIIVQETEVDGDR